ncbi:DUF1127 domain-containing protein [Inquilinus limosus]|uniref:DUF1127 domain-containing protein n=1 Tax=Inquilinus limosus TaxID=171674 RepID=UPI003F16A9E2
MEDVVQHRIVPLPFKPTGLDGLSERLLAVLASLWRSMAEYNRIRRDEQRLAEMSDGELLDIGLHRVNARRLQLLSEMTDCELRDIGLRRIRARHVEQIIPAGDPAAPSRCPPQHQPLGRDIVVLSKLYQESV